MRLVPSPQNSIIDTWRRWLEPRSINRDEAFRERTIRTTASIVIILTAVVLIASRLVYRAEWTLISYSSMIVLMLIISSASAYAVHKTKLFTAGVLLVMTIGLGGIGSILIDGYWAVLGLPGLMLTVLIASLVLQRYWIMRTVVIAIMLQFIIGQLQTANGFFRADLPAPLIATNTLVMLVIEGLFLRQLRVEFDSRLADMRVSIQQTELARQEADRANQAKSQFLANMSHELRTPLNAIIGYIEIMLGGLAGTFTDKQTSIQKNIQFNAQRLLLMINDLLDLSKIEAGAIQITASKAEPRKVINEIISSMSSLAQRKSITLSATYAPDLPETISTDVSKVQQILTNLIGNAIKFTAKGGVTVEVSQVDAGHWRLKVVDTGIGMPAEALHYIFEKFRQVNGSDGQDNQGTGLGLAITKGLIDCMNGTVQVETNLGQGSSFTVTLPYLH